MEDDPHLDHPSLLRKRDPERFAALLTAIARGEPKLFSSLVNESEIIQQWPASAREKLHGALVRLLPELPAAKDEARENRRRRLAACGLRLIHSSQDLSEPCPNPTNTVLRFIKGGKE